MSNTIRFLGDENFNEHIVFGLRRLQPAIDFMLATEAGTLGLSDPDVLAFAAAQDRVLVSHDIKTMPDHFAQFLVRGQQSPGLILISQKELTQRAIELLLLAWQASTPEDWRNLYDILK